MSGHSNILLSYGEAAAGNGLLTNLEAYWKLDDASATQTDSHASYDGTITGATHSATGILNNAVSFDGSGDYINMGDVLDFERTDSFSISCWCKPAAVTGALTLVAKRDSGTGAGYGIVRRGSAGGYYIGFDLGNSFSSNWLFVSGATTAVSSSATWYHVVCTYDGSSSASGVKIYVNGAAESLTTVYNSLSATTLTSYPFNIGSRNNGASQVWNGTLDEVGVWSRELSSTDVTVLNNGGSPLPYSSYT